MDLSIPFKTRAEYIECLAALSASYPEDMSRKVTGANRCIGEILASSCMPQRLEFLWNNLRWRHDVRLVLSVHVFHVTYDLTVPYLPATTGPSELVLLVHVPMRPCARKFVIGSIKLNKVIREHCS